MYCPVVEQMCCQCSWCAVQTQHVNGAGSKSGGAGLIFRSQPAQAKHFTDFVTYIVRTLLSVVCSQTE